MADTGLALTQADRDFFDVALSEVTGWLLPGAAHFTTYLLKYQNAHNNIGPILEFGVFEGKYFLLLHRQSAENEISLGIDIFSHSQPDTTLKHARALLGSDRGVRLHKASSGDMSSEQILALLGGRRARFISVDGDHTGPGVFRDLQLAEKLLAPGGCIAVDDVGNPNAMGVAEGFYKYFLQPDCPFTPIVWVQNKTFCCFRADLPFYRELTLSFAANNPDLEMVREFEKRRQNGQQWVEQDLLGGKILILP